MLRKVFILDIFGVDYNWMDKYVANCNTLAQYGWNWVIVTDQDIKGGGNVQVVPMTQKELEHRIKVKLGIDVDLEAKRKKDGRAIGEFHPAFGVIFSEMVSGYDFWGYTNSDVIYGRLYKWMTDEFLNSIDIFGADNDQMNGVFSLLRNNELVNNMFREIPEWANTFKSDVYSAVDEIAFSTAIKKARFQGRVRAEFKWLCEGDRFNSEHIGHPQVRLEPDGAIINTVTGKEIMMFHFGGCKRWCV